MKKLFCLSPRKRLEKPPQGYIISLMKDDRKLFERTLMTLIGQVVLGFGAGVLRASVLGTDPYQCFTTGISMLTQSFLDYGTTFVIINAVFLFLMFIFARSYIGISTFFNMFLLGYIIDYSSRFVSSLVTPETLCLKLLLLFIALFCVCFGSALIFTSDLGVSTYDWIALHLADIQKRISFKWIRIFTDVMCVAAGLCFGVMPGVGTIITAFALGPVISFFRKYVTEPILNGKKTE